MATTHLPPPPIQTGRLMWQHADGTFFTESQTSLTDVTVAFYPPPSTSSYGDLYIISGFDSNSWLNGLCLGLHTDRNGAIGVGPYFQYGSAILDVGGVELTTGDQPSTEEFGVDYFYSSKVWSLDPMTNQLSVHWNYAIGSFTPMWFSTSMFWIWPAGQGDPFGDGYPWVTNDPSIPTEPFLGEDRIQVGMYFLPDDSIVFNGPPQNYPWY
ncbi:hypothetical protein FRB99_002423 [Tulasnella sp. 403]|nr:hypothetical protein FRB99_002423 [Tulasnella sp. 403]